MSNFVTSYLFNTLIVVVTENVKSASTISFHEMEWHGSELQCCITHVCSADVRMYTLFIHDLPGPMHVFTCYPYEHGRSEKEIVCVYIVCKYKVSLG